MMSERLIYMYTSDKKRARAKCVDLCKWSIYASQVLLLGIEDVVVKRFHDV